MLRIAAVSFMLWLPVQAAEDPASLNIHVLEGEGQSYVTGSRATKGITVRITDEIGKPVDGATVTFRLPEEGPSGTFTSGSKTEIATSRADGTANAWGMQWNKTPGPFEVRITVSKGEVRAGTVCALNLSKGAEGSQAKASSGHGGHKWLWVTVAVGAAAGGGFAAVHGSAGATPQVATVSITRIGTPTISIGHP